MSLFQVSGILAGLHPRNLMLGTECCRITMLIVNQWPKG